MTVVDLLRTHVQELPRAYADHLPEGLPLPTKCPGMAHVLEWAIPGVIAICKDAEHLGCVWKVVLRRGTVHASLVAEWSLTARALAEELISRTRAGDLMVMAANDEVARLRAELLAAREIAAGEGSSAPALAEVLIALTQPGDLTVTAPDDEVDGPGAEPVAASGSAAGEGSSATAKRPRPSLVRAGSPRPSNWGNYFTTTRLPVGHPESQTGRWDEINALAVMLDPRDGTLAGAINVSQWLITEIMDKGRPVSTDIARRVHALLRTSL